MHLPAFQQFLHTDLTIALRTVEIVLVKGELMKKVNIKSMAAVAIVAAMGVSIPAVASASSPASSTSNRATTAISAKSSVNSDATVQWKAFQASWRAYVDGLRSIRLTFRSSVESDRATYFAARAAATTPAERQAAVAALEAALSASLNARVTAITAAGDPPAPPAGYNGTAYVMGIQAANVAFRATIVTAQTTLSAALAVATTRAEARTARWNYDTALGNALVVRSAALLALGTPPAHPGQPA
jgi:hypothetical protein